MAAALPPRTGSGSGAGAESEGQRRLLRAVTRLQACARGFLLRRRLRCVREEFEAVVQEIEGDLGQLRWIGSVLQRPSFGPEPSHPREAAEKDERIPKRAPEKADPPGAERAGGFGNNPSSTPLPRGTTPNPPNLGSGADKNPERKGSREWDEESETSEWESSEPGAELEIPVELQSLPRSELQSYRNHLLMELLWIQQAIASRKNFLMLKRKLGIPNCSGSIPEFLDWCGETLELQHLS